MKVQYGTALLFFLCAWFHASSCTNNPWYQLQQTVENNLKEQNKIYNGSEAQSTPPFFVAIVATDGETYGFICGGSLLDVDHVLTAAHCTDGIKEDMDSGLKFEAWLVPTNIHDRLFKQRIPILDKKSVFTYTGYELTDIAVNDIGIVALSQSARIGDGISTICLGNSDNEYHNIDVTLVGFGNNGCDRAGNNLLLIGTGKSVSAEKCVTKINGQGVPENSVCAELLNNNHEYAEQAPGDSGGPLFYSKSSFGITQYVQIGIVSYTHKSDEGCPITQEPGVYTIPSKYTSFFKEVGASPTYC